MFSSIAFVIFCFGLDFAISCKPVEYEFKQFGVTHYGYGAKKGCFLNKGYAVNESAKATDLKVFECSAIKKGANLSADGGPDLSTSDDEDLEERCNSRSTCVWKGGKCQASSCPDIKARWNCGGKFKNGKCEKLTGDECVHSDSGYTPTPSNDSCATWLGPPPAYPCPNSGSCASDSADGRWFCQHESSSGSSRPPCNKLTDYYSRSSDNTYVKYTDDEKKICEYKCAHPEYSYSFSGPYQYTVPYRKYCNKQLGCLTALSENWYCSMWSIWAFILVLVLLILLVVAIIVVVVILVIKCKKKPKSVDPEESKSTQAAGSGAGSAAAAPAAQDKALPQAESAPQGSAYVVIKVGSQEKQTSKVVSTSELVWGQTVEFTGMGQEDDDVHFEVWDKEQIGTASLRIPEYVNTKKRALIPILNLTGVEQGALEADIAIQVQEQPTLAITGVFFVDKFKKLTSASKE